MQDAGGELALQRQCKRLQTLTLDLEDSVQLQGALQGVTAVVHTAGPYLGKQPDVLKARCPCIFNREHNQNIMRITLSAFPPQCGGCSNCGTLQLRTSVDVAVDSAGLLDGHYSISQ